MEAWHSTKEKHFRFEDTLRSYPAARGIVHKSWLKKDFGDEVEILHRKIRRTLKALFFWNRNKCIDLCMLRDELKKDILDLQTKEMSDGSLSVDELCLLRHKVHELNVTLKRLATWRNKRAKTRWIEEGDVNSSFFHNFASAKRSANLIKHIRSDDNRIVYEEEQIEHIFLHFFLR
ncbi:uncharacterized protein LOC110099256 [Dendrobium catenatum]|uniref:uncharacterized protein LOC110099256 n=1 Tax=Dendrobium catenatum TaxID=906689 RepID=UPI0009F41551|nr:uncharacterized protein LOC110099256 [Dendrobium catenatum]